MFLNTPPRSLSPEHDSQGRPNLAKIKKPIYGIQQAGRRLQHMLFNWLTKQGFTALDDSDPYVFRLDCADGEVLIDRRYEIELPGYTAQYLRASSSPAGGAVVVGYSWAGGRIDSATRLLVFGRDGLPAGGEVGMDLTQDLGGADVAMSGRSILLHRAAPEVNATDVLLYECF